MDVVNVILAKKEEARLQELMDQLLAPQKPTLRTDETGPSKLLTFLFGTLDRHSPIRKLRGFDPLLRIIWTYACSEWWDLHIQRWTCVPAIPDLRSQSGQAKFDRKTIGGCPLAVVNKGLTFPPRTVKVNGQYMPVTDESCEGEALCINMMPFNLLDPFATLPEWLYQYIPLIKKCRTLQKLGEASNLPAYLTIDERPVSEGESQRRGGVHVESPGSLRTKDIGDKSGYVPHLDWYHRWGMGRATVEYLEGGIYLASNTPNSTAVWNCRVHDTYGDMVAPHGSLERMREILGEPAKVLEAGEIVWISDRTPHESLPLKQATKRQFFRLVVGEISFWFSNHSTANPLYELPSSVQIVEGNKFEMTKNLPIFWEPGSVNEIKKAQMEAEYRDKLYSVGLGFIVDDLLQFGIYSRELWIAFTKIPDSYQKLKEYFEAKQFPRYTITFIFDQLWIIEYEMQV